MLFRLSASLYSSTNTKGHKHKGYHETFTVVKRQFGNADIGINTASSCDGPTCFVPELVAGSASIKLT